MAIKTHKHEEMVAVALFYIAPHKVEIRAVDVPFVTNTGKDDHVLVTTLWSGISRGTERLIFEGLVPPSEYSRMRAPFQDGDFPYPVKYGYMAVGIVDAGPPSLIGRSIFCLHPHQDRFAVPSSSLTCLPDTLPPKRCILAANMETALNALWDGGAAPGDKIVIVGAGALGLLIANIASRIPGAEVTVADINETRRGIVHSFGAAFAHPDMLDGMEADLVFHTSATASGLSASLNAAGFEAKVVEVSWYGAKDVATPFGGAFHSKRLKLISSQVGAVADSRRARWTHARRLEMALNLLHDERLDGLITDEVEFKDLPERMASIFNAPPASLVTAVKY